MFSCGAIWQNRQLSGSEEQREGGGKGGVGSRSVEAGAGNEQAAYAFNGKLCETFVH